MSSTITDVVKVHVSCLRFSTDVDVGISIEHRERELIPIHIDERSVIEKAADAALSGLGGLFRMLTGAPQAHQEAEEARGTVMTYIGRQLPPKVVLTAPWGSKEHALFVGEFDRMVGEVTGIEPAGGYKFDVEVRIRDQSYKLLGCFVADEPQQVGDLAVIPLSIDLAC